MEHLLFISLAAIVSFLLVHGAILFEHIVKYFTRRLRKKRKTFLSIKT